MHFRSSSFLYQTPTKLFGCELSAGPAIRALNKPCAYGKRQRSMKTAERDRNPACAVAQQASEAHFRMLVGESSSWPYLWLAHFSVGA